MLKAFLRPLTKTRKRLLHFVLVLAKDAVTHYREVLFTRHSGESSPPVPWVVLSSPRTGSTLLVSWLRSHPSIHAKGELLHGQALVRRPWIRQRPRWFVKRCFTQPQGETVRAAGFKLFYRHCRSEIDLVLQALPLRCQERLLELWPWLVKHREIRIIHLTRRNLLRQYASVLVARSTQRWLAHREDPVRKTRVRVDPVALLSWAAAELVLRQYHRRLFATHQTLELEYEGLVASPQQSFDQVLIHLDLPPGHRPHSALVKQNDRPLPAIITNYDSLIQSLNSAARSGFPTARAILDEIDA